MTMVSIVVPVYNVAEYLPRCLDSLFGQELLEPMEVILVDDGSTDSSPDICERYREEHPEAVVIHQENKGLSEARNAGIKDAKGEWIYFLDGDDWLAPGALHKLINYAEGHSCDMVIGAFYYAYDSYLLYDDRWFKGNEPFVMNREEAMRALILQRYFKNFAWGKLYRTEIVKKHPFRPGVYFEDSFWQHLIVDETRRVGVIPAPLYYYRQRSDSISGTFSERNLDLLKGNEIRLLFLKKNYPGLAPLAAKRFKSLVQSCLDYATGKPELKHKFYSYAEEHGISRRKKLLRLLSSVVNRLTARKPTVIPLNG